MKNKDFRAGLVNKLFVLRILIVFLIILLLRFIIASIMGVFSITDDAHEINESFNDNIYKILNFPLGMFEKNKWPLFLVLLNSLIQSVLIISGIRIINSRR